MCGKSEASGESSRLTKQAFHKKTGVVFQSAAFAVPCGGGEWPVENCLSDCYSPLEPSNASPLGHQSQVVKGCPLCGLHGPTGFSKAA